MKKTWKFKRYEWECDWELGRSQESCEKGVNKNGWFDRFLDKCSVLSIVYLWYSNEKPKPSGLAIINFKCKHFNICTVLTANHKFFDSPVPSRPIPFITVQTKYIYILHCIFLQLIHACVRSKSSIRMWMRV